MSELKPKLLQLPKLGPNLEPWISRHQADARTMADSISHARERLAFWMENAEGANLSTSQCKYCIAAHAQTRHFSELCSRAFNMLSELTRVSEQQEAKIGGLEKGRFDIAGRLERRCYQLLRENEQLEGCNAYLRDRIVHLEKCAAGRCDAT